MEWNKILMILFLFLGILRHNEALNSGTFSCIDQVAKNKFVNALFCVMSPRPSRLLVLKNVKKNLEYSKSPLWTSMVCEWFAHEIKSNSIDRNKHFI